ncbi:MAG TPA: MmgE/PrpD family protein, partial [Burkholderiales bacterium]|nr:MmgE/PrpD family protein [Burkholderiales bacterium]
VNGTAAHCMDFDDTHIHGGGHISAPCWSASLAVAADRGVDEMGTLKGFITGFEVMARLGGGGPTGVGRNLHRRGFHPTSILGRIGAAIVAGVLMHLDERQFEYALGIAATTAGGLIGSFGTHAKPFHGGKAAMDGIMAAQLAARGFESATQLLELEKGLLDSIIQDRKVDAPPLDFSARWEILRNGFKPYASCRATHASIQAARKLAARIGGKKIVRVAAKIHPNAMVAAGKLNPRTPLECKFSISFCIALGLRDYRVVATDFIEETFADRTVTELLPCIELEVVQNQPQYEAHMDVYLEDGSQLHEDTAIVLGHADNPMSEEDFRGKFDGLVVPVLGADAAAQLYALLNEFQRPGNFSRVMALLARNRRAEPAPC